MPSGDIEVLVRALGEFAVLLRKRHSFDKIRNADKQAILKWLRSLRLEELASLCCVEDVGFVKTLLHMAACSRACPTKYQRIQEFQLLPPKHLSSAVQHTRTLPKTPQSSAPREYVKRPVVQTADGDLVGSLHSREYEECCLKLLKSIRVLNTAQSCDTVALSMAFILPAETKEQRDKIDFYQLMDLITYGAFLTECPSDTTLKHRIWGETKELNIWFFWNQRQKDINAKIPLRGLASKLYLVQGWETAGYDKQSAAMQALSSKMLVHLKDLRQSRKREAQMESFSCARFSLEALLSFFSETSRRENQGASVDNCFSVSLEGAIASPQAAVMKLLLAEHFQGHCSLLLSERLSNEEEDLKLSSATGDPSINRGLIGGDSRVLAQGASHSQRRRASRKKVLKQRRRDGEIRALQHTRLNCVLRELSQYFRKKRKEAVKKGIRNVNEKAADAQITVGGCKTTHKHTSFEHIELRQKKKKKSKKKKADKLIKDDASQVAQSSPPPLHKIISSSTKPRSHQVSEKGDAEEFSVVTAGIDSSPSEHALPRQTEHFGDTKEDIGPRLNYIPQVRSTETATPSLSPLSTLPSFGTHSLYSSATATPYFLSVASRDHYPQSPYTIHRKIFEDDGNDGKTPLSRVGPDIAAREPQTFSEASNCGWYLPSVLSLQTPPHRTMCPTPPLDWHYTHWQYKASDGGMPDKSTLSDAVAIADFDPPPPIISTSSVSSALSQSTNTRMSGSTKNYSLASFSKIAGLDASQKGTPPSEFTKGGLTMASVREHDSDSSAADSEKESDFLYREGGFFDRQRSLKRRRRPWPFNYAREEDDESIVEEQETSKLFFKASSTKNCDSWNKCSHCCKCACHRADSSQDTTEEALNEEGHQNQHIHTMPNVPTNTVQAPENDLSAKLALAFERITQLENKMHENSKVVDDKASNSSAEIASLKQAVATLTAQLLNFENEVQTLQLQQGSGCPSGLDGSSPGNASSYSSPQAPFSPAPSSLEQHVDSPSSAAFPRRHNYTPTNSVMGPFVSVPLSVLPPRSKLHWDLCEFAAQLQADSDARFSAQLGVQRLCTATVQSLWPRAQVRPYGSHVTRLVLPSSDVDLVICLPKVRRDAPADAAGVLEGRNAIKETWQQNLARKLKQEPWVMQDTVKTLPHAAVPIITLLTASPYNVRLDISFEGPGHNGLATNDVVMALLHEFPPLAPMMLFLKSFAIERGLAVAYSGGLSSYALLLLAARYLQEHSDTMPNGFANASRAVQHSLSTVQAGVADFGLMLMGFLDFYGNRFDPRTTGISVATRCFLNRESAFMAGAVAGSSSMNDPHQVPHQYQQQYAADDAAVDDRTSQYGYYAQHWQVSAQPQMQLLPNVDSASAHGSRRYGYRSSLDLPASRAQDGLGATTGLLDYQQLQQQTYDPHKFDPVFIEDPLCPSNNVGRNCFRIMQIRRAFSAAHFALLAASRDPTMFADNRVDLVAGVMLHPDNILRAILGQRAPVNTKPDATTSANIGVTAYIHGMDHPHPYVFHPNNLQQQNQQYAYHHHQYHQPAQQPFYQTGMHPLRSVSACSNEPSSRRHSESESAKLTTRSTTSAASHNPRTQRRQFGSPRLILQSQDPESRIHSHLSRQKSTDRLHRQSKLQLVHSPSIAKALSRKNSERSMSFADVVRDGGGSSKPIPKTSPLSLPRPPRFSRDDMALKENINERWETKDDSDLK
ncbi:hypothetical protein CCR75_004266 [Bremia lactucae]|uniref:Poly(A) RNA polymerase mitochondrial-like central palm domain-containing protein n=1 Tax=Bremia lactucae TaxID=4779 RepID=A0A976IJS9_BRELC|nr:hypothetical protein CCR75_004266 [Bremia lactucae]